MQILTKILIEYSNNDLEEKKEEFDWKFTKQKTDPYNDKYTIDFRLSDVLREDKNTLLRRA